METLQRTCSHEFGKVLVIELDFCILQKVEDALEELVVIIEC
jgi:hypothetical protein